MPRHNGAQGGATPRLHDVGVLDDVFVQGAVPSADDHQRRAPADAPIGQVQPEPPVSHGRAVGRGARVTRDGIQCLSRAAARTREKCSHRALRAVSMPCHPARSVKTPFLDRWRRSVEGFGRTKTQNRPSSGIGLLPLSLERSGEIASAAPASPRGAITRSRRGLRPRRNTARTKTERRGERRDRGGRSASRLPRCGDEAAQLAEAARLPWDERFVHIVEGARRGVRDRGEGVQHQRVHRRQPVPQGVRYVTSRSPRRPSTPSRVLPAPIFAAVPTRNVQRAKTQILSPVFPPLPRSRMRQASRGRRQRQRARLRSRRHKRSTRRRRRGLGPRSRVRSDGQRRREGDERSTQNRRARVRDVHDAVRARSLRGGRRGSADGIQSQGSEGGAGVPQALTRAVESFGTPSVIPREAHRGGGVSISSRARTPRFATPPRR